MASGLKLVLLILLTLTWTSIMSYPTSKRFKSKNETNPTMHSSRSTIPTNDVTNQTLLQNGSRMCNLTVDQSLLETISELTQDSAINIVELQLFVGSANESRLLPDVTWTWANKVGREIMSIFSSKYVHNVRLEAIRTLTVGRIKLAVQIYENPQGCIPSKKNGTSFVAKTLLQKLFRTSNTEYQMCYVTKKRIENGLIETEYTCCKIFRKGQQRQCYVYSSYLTDIIYYYLTSYMMALPYIVSPLLLSRFLESSRESKYYRIIDRPMSLSSIIYSVFFEGYGPVKSFVRRLIFIGLFFYLKLDFFTERFLFYSGDKLIFFYDILFVYWAVFFPFSDVFKKNKTPPLQRFLSRTTNLFSNISVFLKNCTSYDVGNVFVSGYDYQSIVNVLTLLFDFKRWRRSLNNIFKVRSVSQNLKCQMEILEFGKGCCYYFMCALFSLLYVVVISLILFLLIIHKMCFFFVCFFYSLMNVSQKLYFISFGHAFLLTVSMLISCGYIFLYFLFIILLLFAGLILNAVYFSPYVTSISILIFYSWILWQSVETKYFTLKMQIYEVCKESLTFGPDYGSSGDDEDDSERGGDNIQNINAHFEGYHSIPDGSVGLSNVGSNNDNDDHGNDGDGNDNHGNDGDGNDDHGNNGDGNDNHGNDGDGNDNHGNNGDGNDDHASIGLNNVGNNGNDGDDGNHHSNNSRIMTNWKYNRNNGLMISKQLYDRIREKILPYNLTLFNFFIKVLLVFLFAYFLFTVINILKTTDVSGTVKVITTMSVIVVPYIFNIVAGKISEEGKKEQNDVQKMKVEKLVFELTKGTDQVYQIYMEMSDDET